MVEYFNFYYFLYILFAFGLVIGLYLLLRNKSRRTCNIVLFCILFLSFTVHFLKLTHESYQVWMPHAIRTATPENICAVSVLLFPWFFLSKSKILKDYMFYMGVASGIGATIIPIDAIGQNAFDFETVRYYLSHIVICAVPLLMVLLKLHTLDYKRILKVPFFTYFVLCIILVNEIILTGAGFVHISHLYSYQVRNSSLIFGPLPEVEFIGVLFTALTPELFLTVPIGANAGEVYYWPIIWLVIPFYIYFCIYAVLLALPFEYKNMKKDILALKTKIFKA